MKSSLMSIFLGISFTALQRLSLQVRPFFNGIPKECIFLKDLHYDSFFSSIPTRTAVRKKSRTRGFLNFCPMVHYTPTTFSPPRLICDLKKTHRHYHSKRINNSPKVNRVRKRCWIKKEKPSRTRDPAIDDNGKRIIVLRDK